MPFSQRLAIAFLAAVCCHLSGAPTTADAAEMQRWMARDDKLLAEAELVDYSDDTLRLKKADGTILTVAYRQMKNDDLVRARTAKASRFQAGGKIRVQNVMEGLPWKVRGTDPFKEGKVYTLMTTQPVEKHGLAILLAQLKIDTPFPPEQQGLIAKAISDQARKTVAEAVESWEFEQRQRDDGPHFGAHGVITRPNDGKRMEIVTELIYRGPSSYLLQVFTLGKDKAEQMALIEGVVSSLEEL